MLETYEHKREFKESLYVAFDPENVLAACSVLPRIMLWTDFGCVNGSEEVDRNAIVL